MGGLLVFMGMMVMMLAAYRFTSGSAQAEAGNQLSQTLKNLMLDTYDSSGGMSFEYELPSALDGSDYSLEVLNKSGDTIGIITRTKSGILGVTGGASLSAPLSGKSFGMLKDFGQELHYICIVKYSGKIYLERSKCS
jgi:hypothetical protein